MLARRVDAVLVDLDLPGDGPVALIADVASQAPELRIVAMTAEDGAARVEAALRAGAHALVTAHAEPGELVRALQAVESGRP